MRLKSLVVIIVTLLVVANVIVAAMRRCGVFGNAETTGRQPTEGVAEVAGERVAATPIPRRSAGIEGLHLQLSRPLMFDVGKLGGLAAAGEHLYVAAWDEGAGAAVLYQVQPDSYAIAQVRVLEEEDATAVGGIDAGLDRVWVPLARGGDAPASVVLGIDPGTLRVRERFEAAAGIAALAVDEVGRVYGVTRDGALWAEWLPDGTVVREVAAAGGVRYADLAHVGGSLVAAGTDGANGILDVIDPGEFTLLARHHAQVRGAEGAWATSGGMAFRGETVLLLPEGGVRPSLLTYVPEGGDLSAFVPSVRALD